MPVTSGQRARAKALEETYMRETLRWKETIDRLHKKRCVMEGVEHVSGDDYRDGKKDWQLYLKSQRVRESLTSMVPEDAFIGSKLSALGFTQIGAGMTRVVYTHKHDTTHVYKVQKSRYRDRDDNTKEIKISLAYHRVPVDQRPKGIYIPRANNCYGVSVAEKCEKDQSEDKWLGGALEKEFSMFMRSLGYRLSDTHGENVYYCKAKRSMVVVDMGHFTPIS